MGSKGTEMQVQLPASESQCGERVAYGMRFPPAPGLCPPRWAGDRPAGTYSQDLTPCCPGTLEAAW